ncbi:MAG: non-canonical purine NTP pyrophosphatase [Terriglobales bacterium]
MGISFLSRNSENLAELDAEEKSRYSHRGAAFRKFLQWMDREESRR